MLKIFFSICFCIAIITPAQANDDMSLVDLFGEEQEETQKQPQTIKKEENKKLSEEEHDEKGNFSFFNFSFLKDKEKQQDKKISSPKVVGKGLEQTIALAEEGNIDACLGLGYMYLYGENGVEQDSSKAFKYYALAAAQQDKIAVNNLGSLYYSGIGTKKDVTKAIQLFDKAAQLGNGEAAINLAFICLTSDKNIFSNEKIVELLQQAADGGNITAQYMMGYAYYRGFVVAKDYKKAFDLMKMAAVSYDEAQYEVAQRYINAEGTPRNYGNAVKYLVLSAQQGNVKAMMELGTILAAGTSYQKNEYEAYIWFNIASVHGISAAAEQRDSLEEILKIEEVLQAQAASETFKEKPSEMTQYIRQTFGTELGKYIDKKMGIKPTPVVPKNEQKIDDNTPAKLL